MFICILVVLVAMFLFILKTWRSVKVMQEESDQVIVPRGRDRSRDLYEGNPNQGLSMEMVNELVRRQIEAERPQRVETVPEKPAQGFGSISEGDLQRLIQYVQSGGGD